MSNEPGQPAPATAIADVTVGLDVPSVALAIGAHPDDVGRGGLPWIVGHQA